jgi:NAD(P)-dependent dehydrogenase (short-subunit alcohol dehydrogenase family)
MRAGFRHDEKQNLSEIAPSCALNNMFANNKVAVITGAASGMGRSLAVLLASKGVRGLALCDVNMTDLEQTAKLAREASPSSQKLKVTIAKVDVSNRANVEQWRDTVSQDFGGVVDMLFNNAGINANGRMVHPPGASKEEIAQVEKDWDRCFNVDFFGVLFCCRAFLPLMIANSKDAYLVNTASVNAFWTWPEHAAYTAAKHAVKGLSDSLHVELQMKAPHVKVSCLFPGGVRTNIAASTLHADAAGVKKVAQVFEEQVDLTADEAADWILTCVGKRQYRILVGYDALLLDKMVRAGPSTVYSFYETLGRMGFTPDLGNLEENKKVAGPLTAARFVASGGWFFLLFMWPYPLLRLRKSVAGRMLLGSLAAATAVGVGKMSAKL